MTFINNSWPIMHKSNHEFRNVSLKEHILYVFSHKCYQRKNSLILSASNLVYVSNSSRAKVNKVAVTITKLASIRIHVHLSKISIKFPI